MTFVLSQPLFSALRASHFLLLRQKKVSKEKATPGYAVGSADFPALLESGGRCGTRATPSDSPRALSAAFSVARRATRGMRSIAQPTDSQVSEYHGQPGENTKYPRSTSVADVFPGPLRGAEQRRNAGGSRLALFEPQASLASRPAFRVAQGIPAGDTDPGVAFSLATFFWRSKRKYARPQGGTPSQLAARRQNANRTPTQSLLPRKSSDA
jgi:hypothetical protein